MRAQAAYEQHARQAQEWINRLNLSSGQARKLLPIAEQAAALHIEAYELQAQFLPEMIDTFSEFAREDSLNQGFTPTVESRTARANHRAKQAQERISEQLIKLEQQASKVLNPRQREQLTEPLQKERPARAKAPRRDARSRARAAARQREEVRRQPLREAREQLHALHQARYPRPGPISRYLLHPFAAEQLCVIAHRPVPAAISRAADVLTYGTPESPSELVEQQKAEVQRLRGEINNWNLINGLYLSEDQIRDIAGLYDRATARSWEIVERDRQSGVPRRALVELECDVEQVLNSGQRQVLADYKACLIPPRNLKDPVRVGQASDNSHYEKWLERARKLPRNELTQEISAALDREAEHFGELSRPERQQRVALLRKTVRQAAAMSDTEFELSKTELAAQIAPPDRIQETKAKVATLARELGETGAITQFMLNPQFMDQLRLRGKQLAEGIGTKQIDLAKGPQAENCDESCAIDGKGQKNKRD
jgi:hypothetical protein